LIKENASDPLACHDIERGITEPFDKLWDDISRAKPAVNLDDLTKKFTEAIRKKSNEEVEDAEHYQ